ncbi:MAG: fatty acid hydroxylase [Cytophagales bacterium]|nr:fatty acid hydroxylase [Cytophagales bacterium]
MAATVKQHMPKNEGTHQLFQNPLIEKLSRTHIAVPTGLFLVISLGLLYHAKASMGLSAALIATCFVAGWFIFTLAEYLVHRYFYHMEPDTPRKEKVQYTLHGVHHEYPKDKDRLAMPPLLSLTVSALLFGVFYLLMGQLAYAFLPGFLLGYSLYLFIHYAVHAFKPPKNMLKWLWIFHAIHHYKDDSVAFGVSSPLWDYVFGTIPKSR